MYSPNSLQGHMTAIFEGKEVEAVSRAFDENNQYLTWIDKETSISAQQRKIASWTGNRQIYASLTNDKLVDPLEYFIDVTEDKVDELLETYTPSTRIPAASARYRYAYIAGVILETIQDSELSGTTARVDQSRYK
jgi:hypothetical protein